MIIIGDGDASPPDPATLDRVIGEGAQVSAIGVDYDHNPKQMDALHAIADRGQGSFQIVPNGNSAAPVLLRTLC